ncbi:electroneutral sodium bicarbonate exchanger 1 [Striga asiatica]|uniref:Electroneutral sodium bicarbonate exchanger 1 n=1 Tax=Striga asiatica TaxID=4170 RepID=A0A5A7QKA3_STRAF|nr:electroneutral sodium bicarbonate exchanger 1 [Striga asiatica]
MSDLRNRAKQSDTPLCKNLKSGSLLNLSTTLFAQRILFSSRLKIGSIGSVFAFFDLLLLFTPPYFLFFSFICSLSFLFNLIASFICFLCLHCSCASLACFRASGPSRTRKSISSRAPPCSRLLCLIFRCPAPHGGCRRASGPSVGPASTRASGARLGSPAACRGRRERRNQGRGSPSRRRSARNSLSGPSEGFDFGQPPRLSSSLPGHPSTISRRLLWERWRWRRGRGLPGRFPVVRGEKLRPVAPWKKGKRTVGFSLTVLNEFLRRVVEIPACGCAERWF